MTHVQVDNEDKPKEHLRNNNNKIKESTLVNESMHVYSEIALPMIHFPHTIEALKNPNIFIGDTGASSNSSQYQNGMVNLHDGQHGDSVMIGSGSVVKASKIGNILGEVCDNRGTVLQKDIW